jgi:hypothetical protein
MDRMEPNVDALTEEEVNQLKLKPELVSQLTLDQQEDLRLLRALLQGERHEEAKDANRASCHIWGSVGLVRRCVSSASPERRRKLKTARRRKGPNRRLRSGCFCALCVLSPSIVFPLRRVSFSLWGRRRTFSARPRV